MTENGVSAKKSNAVAGNWYAATGFVRPPARVLAGDLDVDVCIIGAGLTGLTIAYQLTRAGWSVAVIDAGEIGASAARRRMGVVTPGFSLADDRIVDRVGVDHARALWALSGEGVAQVRRTIADCAMAGVTLAEGRLAVCPGDAGEAERVAARLRDQFAVEVEVWSADRVRATVSSPAAGAALMFPQAFAVHPGNYAQALAQAVETAGGRLFAHTRALSVDGDGVRKRVQTTGGRIRAAQIVLAAGADGALLHPLLRSTVMMLSRPMAVTAPLGERLPETIGFSGIVENGQARYHIAGDRLVWEGPTTTARTLGFGGAHGLRRQIRRLQPAVGAPRLEHAWIASMACTVHGMPQVGQLAPGFWLAAAFADHGLNVTAVAGDMIARGIRDGDDRWRLFKPYGLVWAGGPAGRVVVAAALTGKAAAGWLKRHMNRPVQPANAPAVQPDAVEVETELPAVLPLAAAAPGVAAPPPVMPAMPIVAVPAPPQPVDIALSVAPEPLPLAVERSTEPEPVVAIASVAETLNEPLAAVAEPASVVETGPTPELAAAASEPVPVKKKLSRRKAKPVVVAVEAADTAPKRMARSRAKSPVQVAAGEKVKKRRAPVRRPKTDDGLPPHGPAPAPTPPAVDGERT